MKVKTSELSGMALCYAVCMIEMPHLVWGKTIGEHHASKQIVVPELPEDKCYGSFASWRMFGPIIEREAITVSEGSPVIGIEWMACDRSSSHIQHGPSYLIAAMRCYCYSKLGDEVEIPEELLK